MSAPVKMTASPEAVKWINENYSAGVRLGARGPLIQSTSREITPAMWRSDGIMVVVVQKALTRWKAVELKPGASLTLVQEG
jgi:hypothetical protein